MIVLVAIIMTSCSLEEEPKYSFNSNTVFNSESTTEAVIMQNYGWLGSSGAYGQMYHENTLANGVYWTKTDGDRSERTVTYDNYAEHPYLNATWTAFYKVISESNYLINGLENSSNLSTAYKNRGIAHARFLRGFAYYKLASLFGKAVLLTEPLTKDNLNNPLSGRSKVYEQALNDLIYASENLPGIESMDGLATKDAAAAFVAKCYWIMASQAQGDGNEAEALQLYKLAKTYGDNVIGKFNLEPNFADLWGRNIENSPESIFQINFTLSEAGGINLRSTFLFGPTGGRAFAPGQPSFGNIKIDRAFYDLHRGTYPDDPRIPTTYMTQWVNVNNGTNQYTYPLFNVNGTVYDMFAEAPRLSANTPTNPDYNYDALPNPVRSRWADKANGDRSLHPYSKKGVDVEANNQYDPKNLVLYRYADLLLLMADVENELGNSPQALTYLNRVLDRARNSGGAAASYPETQTAVSKEELRDKIFFERMFELAGEPCLFEDIRRRGTTYLSKVLELHNNSRNVTYRYDFEVENNVGGAFRDYIFNNCSITEDFLKKNLLLPIPLEEINTNDNISQEDQNFGY